MPPNAPAVAWRRAVPLGQHGAWRQLEAAHGIPTSHWVGQVIPPTFRAADIAVRAGLPDRAAVATVRGRQNAPRANTPGLHPLAIELVQAFFCTPRRCRRSLLTISLRASLLVFFSSSSSPAPKHLLRTRFALLGNSLLVFFLLGRDRPPIPSRLGPRPLVASWLCRLVLSA